MQHLTILLLGISAGIAGDAGVTHLLIGAARRPRDATHLLFGLLSLSIAAHALVVLALRGVLGQRLCYSEALVRLLIPSMRLCCSLRLHRGLNLPVLSLHLGRQLGCTHQPAGLAHIL
jgi:hypothetical protein